jgi:hypothetical protein
MGATPAELLAGRVVQVSFELGQIGVFDLQAEMCVSRLSFEPGTDPGSWFEGSMSDPE